jgi:transketolase
MHTGVTVGADGATRQMLEDITLMRVMPNMRVEVPVDAEEVHKTLRAITWNNKPTYVRIARHESRLVTTPDTPFREERAELLRESSGPRVAIIGAGPILCDALAAAERLEGEGVGSLVLNVHSIKPMDVEAVKDAARRAGAVVSVEEHQILGGVGSTLAEIFAQNTPVPMEMVAVHDRFGQSGTPEELFQEYRLTVDAIVEAVRRVLARKA